MGSKELKDMIKKVDDEIYNLIKQMTSLGLDDVSLMVFSDHGMANIQETVDLSKTLDMDDMTALIPEGTTVKIWPKPGLIDKVFWCSQLIINLYQPSSIKFSDLKVTGWF